MLPRAAPPPAAALRARRALSPPLSPAAAPSSRRAGSLQRAAALPPQAAMALSTAAVLGAAAGVAAWLGVRSKTAKPELTYTDDGGLMASVLARCPTLHTEYRPVPFLTNAHVETIAIAKLRSDPKIPFRREIVRTRDGGVVAVDWEHKDLEEHDLPEDAPVIVLLPGLTGGSTDTYVQHAVQQARAVGVRAAVFNSRGTASSPVVTPQFYSASFTDDTRDVIAHVQARFPRASALFAAGWSLGANILVNYLGEEGDKTPVEAAVSMCNPFDLTISNAHLQRGFNKIYDWNLAASLRRIFAGHMELWRNAKAPLRPDLVPTAKTIREFDEAITIHSFGWPSVDAYYAGSSSSKKIPAVTIPLLCIQAANDPIAPADAIPYDAIRANPNVALAVTPAGGHLGWAAGPGAPFGHPWSDGPVTEFLANIHLALLERKAAAGKAGVVRVQADGRGGVDGGSSSSDSGDGVSGRAAESAAAAMSAPR